MTPKRAAAVNPLALMLVLMIAYWPARPSAAPDPGVFDCEYGQGDTSDGWLGGPDTTTAAADSVIRHSGLRSGRLHRTRESQEQYSTLKFSIPADRQGQTIELRGWLKSQDVSGWYGLWIIQDGVNGKVAYKHMQESALSGTSDWTEYRISQPLSPKANNLQCGAMLVGSGTVWADDLSLWIDGRPLAEAPAAERPLTVLETDTEFTRGSGISQATVSEVQADNLALLGRVWGFLKYHHPAVTTGTRQWDFELFRVMPRVLAAADRAAAHAVIVDWIDGLGPIPPCAPCAKAPSSPAQAPSLNWISDRETLGDALSARLTAAHAARPADGRQFWVQFSFGAGYPEFGNEPAYRDVQQVDAGYRLLALFRFWNIVEYWSPYRDVIGEDWSRVLREYVPKLVAATDEGAYQMEMLALIARLNDGHAQLQGGADRRPPGRAAQIPVQMRWVENRPTVTGWAQAEAGPASGLQIGDAILSVDGHAVDELMREWAPYYSASNEPYRLAKLATAIVRGPAAPCRLGVLREGRELELTVERLPLERLDEPAALGHVLPGRAFRLLAPGVAYLALDDAKRDSVKIWIEDALAHEARGLVIDCRAYPGDPTFKELTGHLIATPTRFANLTGADPTNPGAFMWAWGSPWPLPPVAPHFPGKVVVLVDEKTLSQAEYHALAFGAAPQSVVMGSTTAGADGNLCPFALPGGLHTGISGVGVFDEARRPTQRVGITLDVEVKPTLAGIREGRDEVLETAIESIIGRKVTADELRSW
jgi:C-terminal processing protease CtpA/Prc